ncbi:MAG: sigma-70 family RNA polymerase sigma factor [Dehalococcoidia bacterium]
MESLRYTGSKENATRETTETKTYEDIEIKRLVKQAIDGDVETFGELYSIYLDRIYRYVFYQVHNKVTAEDLTEEIFMKAWRGIGKYRWKGQPFSAWLYRIAHNHVIDYFRTSRQHQPLDREIPADGDQPQQELETKQIQQSLLRAISSLPQQQKQVITLKFIEDLDNRAIEHIMGKSQGAIRVMQMRALAALRQILNEEMEECEPIYQRL